MIETNGHTQYIQFYNKVDFWCASYEDYTLTLKKTHNIFTLNIVLNMANKFWEINMLVFIHVHINVYAKFLSTKYSPLKRLLCGVLVLCLPSDL